MKTMKTYTEEQIRSAWKRATKRIEDDTTDRDKTIDTLMDELNEPEYPASTVWKDADGRVLLRVSSGWLQVGSASYMSYNAPKRPLKELVEKGV